MSARGARPWTLGRGYLLLLPLPCGFLTLFFVWPLLRVVLRSVLEPRPGFANYAKVLFSGPFLQILVYTLEIAALVTSDLPAIRLSGGGVDGAHELGRRCV